MQSGAGHAALRASPHLGPAPAHPAPCAPAALQWQKAGPLPISFGQQWIDTHARVASELGKPLVLEEFGAWRCGGAGRVSAVQRCRQCA